VGDSVRWSATKIAQAIRSRELSCDEVIRTHIARIEEVNPKLNAVVQLCSDRAIEEARAADQALARGELNGPLHGVPITIKDNLDTAGIISTGGTKGREGFVPTKDATVVARLRGAGAILLGKTNTPELTMAYETENLIYGRTNNPYDQSYTCGGSSGGAAAILAVGGTALDVGSDTGGSIRVPSHFCGTAGIKPTAGLIPKTGHILPLGGIVDAMTQLGPMARKVEDLALTLPVLAGVDWRDPSVVPMSIGNFRDVSVKDCRIAFFRSNGIFEPCGEIAAAIDLAVKLLNESGVSVKEGRPAVIEDSYDLTLALWTADGGSGFEKVLRDAGTNEVHSFMASVLDECRAGAKSGADFSPLLERWSRFRSEMLKFIEPFDVLLSPVLPFAALPHGSTFNTDRFPGFSYTMTYNLTGWPAAVVRVGTSTNGLPIGVQLASKPWREHVALAVADYLEETLGLWPEPRAGMTESQ
jgi:amidase